MEGNLLRFQYTDQLSTSLAIEISIFNIEIYSNTRGAVQLLIERPVPEVALYRSITWDSLLSIGSLLFQAVSFLAPSMAIPIFTSIQSITREGVSLSSKGMYRPCKNEIPDEANSF